MFWMSGRIGRVLRIAVTRHESARARVMLNRELLRKRSDDQRFQR